jgi:hypothetical protein
MKVMYVDKSKGKSPEIKEIETPIIRSDTTSMSKIKLSPLVDPTPQIDFIPQYIPIAPVSKSTPSFYTSPPNYLSLTPTQTFTLPLPPQPSSFNSFIKSPEFHPTYPQFNSISASPAYSSIQNETPYVITNQYMHARYNQSMFLPPVPVNPFTSAYHPNNFD